jgi:hypothetical protein
MTDFAAGWVVYEARVVDGEHALRSLGLAAFISPADEGAFAVFPDDDPIKRGFRFSRLVPSATVVAFSSGDDQPFAVAVFRGGKRVLQFQMDSHAQPKVVRGHLVRLAKFLPEPRRTIPASCGWAARDVYNLLGFSLAYHGYPQLATATREDPEAHEGMVHLDATGSRKVITHTAEDEEAELEKILAADRKQARKAARPRPKPSPADAEVQELSRSLAELSRKLGSPGEGSWRPAGGTRALADLAHCRSAREWLDARRSIDPSRATPELLAELERTIDGDRFADEGEAATIVREAAGMLLGRALVAQRGVAAAVKTLSAAAEKASNPASRNAWQVAIDMAAGSGDTAGST